MNSTRLCRTGLGVAFALAAGTTVAGAQEAAPAAPAQAATPSPLDRLYDGNTHISVAPYLWGPTVTSVFQYSVPALRGGGGKGATIGSVSVTPSQYLAKLNSAAMIAFDARKGAFDVFGDGIYLNASASATAYSTITLGRGRITIPATFNTNARLSAGIWEAAAGYTVARSSNSDLSMFAGIRQFPINVTLAYSATIGRHGLIAPSGTITSGDMTSDFIFGLRGQAYLGSGRFFIPYYADLGTALSSVPNTTWQAYGGAGYSFDHGQRLLLVYRTLNYDGFNPDDHIQKVVMAGPLLGYSFNL